MTRPDLKHSRPRHSNRVRLRLEALEKRELLAGDLSPAAIDPPAHLDESVQVARETERALAPDLVQFAQNLADAGVAFFGAHWCPACTEQKELFGDGKDNLPFIEVTNPDRSIHRIGVEEMIDQFPTWVFPDGSRLVGVQSLETLSQRSGVPIPQGESPTFELVGDLTVQTESPLHVPIDAYDPNGGPLTVTVSVADPDLLQATVLSGNRSIRMDMRGWGDMVFQLFEQRAPIASSRVADLAADGFYDEIIFHRVVNNFVIQAGDPTGTGTSGSSLGAFDDEYHPDLQHNREGVLSFAKSSDDTNNSQFFIAEVPTRFLDFNHSVFGQLVEGFDVREAISNTSTPDSRGDGFSQRPDIDVVIRTIEVFDDMENSMVMLKATGNRVGTTAVTFTVTDQDGNTYSQTVQVTVVRDTANSQPFLGTITPPPVTPANQTAQLQLTSTDLEGDPVRYLAQSLSSPSDGTVTVDQATGLVSVTPARNFVGIINVRVGVEPGSGVIGNAATDSDTQLVSFRFGGPAAVLAPTSVDLRAESDAGSSNIDNITNVRALSFLVEGLSSSAVVELVNVDEGAVIGTGVASGSSAVITTFNIAALGDGTYRVAARQVIDNVTNALSPSIVLEYDATLPESVAGRAATTASVGRPYESNLGEGLETGLIYVLNAAPDGATMDATTGVVDWIPGLGQLGTHRFVVTVADIAGNARSESFDVTVRSDQLEIKLEVTDLRGRPISAIEVGQSFLLRMFGVDRRLFNQRGVFSAFADILFDGALVRPQPGSTILFEDEFSLVQKGTFSDGLIDELGAVNNSLVATDESESLIATVRMEAIRAGRATIQSDPADESDSEMLMFGIDDAIPTQRIVYGQVELLIGQGFTPGDDAASFDLRQGQSLRFDAGSGDDTVIVYLNADGSSIDATFNSGDDRLAVDFGAHTVGLAVDGGTGVDVFEIAGSDTRLAIDELPVGSLLRFEAVDFTGNGDNTLVLSPQSLMSITDSANVLTVLYDAGDTLQLTGPWQSEGGEFVDGRHQHRVTSAGTTLIIVNDNPWQNPIQLTDVDANGVTRASDALQIINELMHRSGKLPAVTSAGLVPAKYFDVSGDGELTSIDVLQVINQLAQLRSQSAESENAVAQSTVLWSADRVSAVRVSMRPGPRSLFGSVDVGLETTPEASGQPPRNETPSIKPDRYAVANDQVQAASDSADQTASWDESRIRPYPSPWRWQDA